MNTELRHKIAALIPDVDHPEANSLRNNIISTTPVNVRLYKGKNVVADADVILPMGYCTSLYPVALYCLLNEYVKERKIIEWDKACFIGNSVMHYKSDLLSEIKDNLICASTRVAVYDHSIDEMIRRTNAILGEGGFERNPVKATIYCQSLYGGIVAHYTDFVWHVGEPKKTLKARIRKALKL